MITKQVKCITENNITYQIGDKVKVIKWWYMNPYYIGLRGVIKEIRYCEDTTPYSFGRVTYRCVLDLDGGDTLTAPLECLEKMR